MKKTQNNFAYIDASNLHNGVASLGWEMDYKRFRSFLNEKYAVTHAYLFIGLIPKNKQLYTYLQEAGFILVYKEVIYDANGKPKGNCDADLVLHAVMHAYGVGRANPSSKACPPRCGAASRGIQNAWASRWRRGGP